MASAGRGRADTAHLSPAALVQSVGLGCRKALYDSQAMACHESTDGRRSHRSCRARGTAPQLVFQPQWSKVGGSPLRVRTSTSSWLIFRGARHCASAPVCGGNGAWLNTFQDRRFNGIEENRQFLDLMGGNSSVCNACRLHTSLASAVWLGTLQPRLNSQHNRNRFWL
jgi:hypothetical protein